MDFNYGKYYDNYVDDNTWEGKSYSNHSNEEILDDITSKKSKFHPRNNSSSYRFTRPTENSWYVKVLKYLMENGPTNKTTLVYDIGLLNNTSYEHEVRGYFSSMFSAMHEAGLISYNNHKITLGPNAEEYLRRHKFID